VDRARADRGRRSGRANAALLTRQADLTTGLASAAGGMRPSWPVKRKFSFLICGVPVAYDPLYWGVFPLAMYSVSTYHLAKILEMSFLLSLSQLFMVAAVLSWGVTFAGLVDSRLNRRSGTQEPHTTSAGPPSALLWRFWPTALRFEAAHGQCGSVI
jgi:hypothetical protein